MVLTFCECIFVCSGVLVSAYVWCLTWRTIGRVGFERSWGFGVRSLFDVLGRSVRLTHLRLWVQAARLLVL